MSVHLVKGSDPVLLGEAVGRLVGDLLGDRERSEVLEEFRGEEYDLSAVVMAACTVSMFGRRMVVARELARFPVADLGPMIDLVKDPPDEVDLVLVWDKPSASGARANPLPKRLTEAVAAGGGTVVDSSPPSGRARDAWVDEQLARAPVELSSGARRALRDTIGEDVHRLTGLLDLLGAAYPGSDRPLTESDVAPFLDDAGGVPPWELTDAIDSGDVATALGKLRRMLEAGARHPLQVMVALQTHFERMLRLDGSGATDEKAAAAVLGLKGSTFPARKAMVQSQRLGSARLTRAVQLLATADVDLRGGSGAPPEAVLELLVARLATISARAGGGRG